jgi:ABC-type sugar transport system substrate-binding protein
MGFNPALQKSIDTGTAYNAGLAGAQALAKSLSGMQQLVYMLVRPADIGGKEGRVLVEQAAVNAFGRVKATDMLHGDVDRASDPWLTALHS